MKLLSAILLLLTMTGIANAAYVNDQSFNQGNGVYLTIMNTTVNNITCCISNTLFMNISENTVSWTAGANKIITYPRYTGDNFTFDISGNSYINFSAVMVNASSSYNLSVNGIVLQTRNTTVGKMVWFNYTGSGVLSVTYSTISAPFPTPTITSWTPTSLATIRTGLSQQFEITGSTGGIDTYHWKFDGVDVGDSSNIYTKTFLYNSSKRNQDHTVTVYGTNETETSNTVTWSTTVLLTAIIDYDFDKNFSDIGLSDLNPVNLSTIGASPYVQSAIGTIFWGILFALIFIMIWMRQDDVTIPSLLGLIIGLSLWAMMPSDWVSMAMSLSIISFFGIMYTLIKGRR